MHNQFEELPQDTITKQFVVLADVQPVSGPRHTRIATYKRTKRFTPNGWRIFRVVPL